MVIPVSSVAVRFRRTAGIVWREAVARTANGVGTPVRRCIRRQAAACYGRAVTVTVGVGAGGAGEPSLDILSVRTGRRRTAVLRINDHIRFPVRVCRRTFIETIMAGRADQGIIPGREGACMLGMAAACWRYAACFCTVTRTALTG